MVNILPLQITIFSLLSNYCQLTVVHSGVFVEGDFDFKQVILKCINIGPFYYQKDLKYTIERINYDEIVFMFDLWWLSSYKYFFNKNKFFLWGNRISNFKLVNKLRNYIMLRSKGNILYSECPIKKC